MVMVHAECFMPIYVVYSRDTRQYIEAEYKSQTSSRVRIESLILSPYANKKAAHILRHLSDVNKKMLCVLLARWPGRHPVSMTSGL